MTQEEKAKAYDEVIKKLRDFYRDYDTVSCLIDVKEELANLIPELAESKDERVRKELIEFVKSRGGFKQEYIAWLEKQGEQKDLDYPYVTGWRKNYKDNKPAVKHSVLMFTTHGVAEGEWLGEEWCQYRWSCKVKDEDVLYWLHLSDLETLEKENVKQGEQNPADKVEPKFKVGQTIKKEGFNLGFTIVKIEDGFYYNDMGDYFPFTDQDNWEFVEQNIVWSEEDERTLNNVIHDLRYPGFNYYKKPIEENVKWLKSLKDRVQPQQEQKWSDVDKDILFRTIDNLKFLKGTISTDPKYAVNIIDIEREITWLKSLRHQNRWKPSDEQIAIDNIK